MNIEKFKNTLKLLAEHLHNFGEDKAGEVVESILKAIDCGIFDE